ncbi:MAG: sugar ABC transporter permease [Anaerolineae bacterium]|nr:sugar ABC transporter permease [Anaerolineae bacterium]MDW8098044.1 sugar ABC transporter permease [Anaerolineae bacterium]
MKIASEVAVRSVARPRPRWLSSRVLWAYVFISPAIFALLIFALGPILFTFWVSLHEWNLITPVAQMPFLGLENYRYLLIKDMVFRQALRNTVVFTVCGVGINTVLGLLGALLLNTPLRARVLWRTLFFLPIVTAPLALGMMWAALLNKNYGLVNTILGLFRIPPQPFLSSPDQALASVIGIAVYQYVGYYIIVYLAGLQGVPQEYYDAAAVDGANRWQSFWHITLPLLRPVLLFIIVTNTIGALQVFDIVFAATTGGAETSGGGPAGSTMVVVLHMYNTAFKFFRMGRATAMATILFAIIFVITLAQLRLLRERT